MTASKPPVPVTGLGCLCAPGHSLDPVMEALYSGQREPRPPRHIESDLEKVFPVFEIESDLVPEMSDLRHSPDFAALDWSVPPTRTNALALLAATEALRQAGLDAESLRHRRVGVCVGTTVGCTLNDGPFYRAWRAGRFPGFDTLARYLNNNSGLYLARALRASGPVATLANACSSGADAIGQAQAWIRNGLCDVVVAGGADELSHVTYVGFASLLITSPAPCRPFDRDRDGLNLGEGAGFVVLESDRSAADRGAAPLAWARGYATRADAHHPTAPHPEGRGLRGAIMAALRDAGLTLEDVDFVNAHGTSTPENDRVEGALMMTLLRAGTPVVSTKAYTGHTLGAAGGIEAALTVRALLDQRLPATAGFETLDPDCGLTPTTANTPLSARVGMSTSLAFGGTNSVLLFSRF
ncbi:MAG TPA: beta-ketoacyl-[acyl-carrier-protein] synthase family protein [Candidatus Sumerlaeota bacterium]|nr:beta-ketoacyl-[acyl-carrier-protein] synthase family protein [Candidatus Sumerlaeota bacterium]